jgi:5-methylcytosine-specific restriction endonuclease McrA
MMICPICHNPATNPAIGPCGHVCCLDCLANWIRDHHTCPICRNSLTEDQLTKIWPGDEVEGANAIASLRGMLTAKTEENVRLKSKLDNLDATLDAIVESKLGSRMQSITTDMQEDRKKTSDNIGNLERQNQKLELKLDTALMSQKRHANDVLIGSALTGAIAGGAVGAALLAAGVPAPVAFVAGSKVKAVVFCSLSAAAGGAGAAGCTYAGQKLADSR